MAETATTTTMTSKYSSTVDTSSSDSDDSDDEAPQAVSAKDAANSEKKRQAQDEQRRAAQRKVRKATSQKQAAKRPTKKADAATSSTASTDDISESAPLLPSTSYIPTSSTSSSSKLDPALFEQADVAFRAVKEAAIRAAAEDQARQAAAEAGAGSATGKSAAKSAGSSDKGKKRRLDDADYVAAVQKAEKAKKRTVGDVTVQQIESSTPSTISTVPKHVPVDVSSALPANKTRAFLQDRLFKRRRSNTVAGPSSRKRRGRQEEKPHLIFDPLLDKKPAKKEKTRTEKKEALRERMRGRQGAVTAFTRGNSQTMAAGFGFKRQ